MDTSSSQSSFKRAEDDEPQHLLNDSSNFDQENFGLVSGIGKADVLKGNDGNPCSRWIRSTSRRAKLCMVSVLCVAVAAVVLLVVGLTVVQINPTSPTVSKDTPAENPCPNTVMIHQSGEPWSYEPWTADFRILAGGANIDPDRSLWYPLLVGSTCKTNCFARGPNYSQGTSLGFIPVKKRTFEDVVFRSAMCDQTREDLVAVVRRTVEAANFTFRLTGLCGGSGYPPNPNFKGRSNWNTCDEGCADSKIMLAFERYRIYDHYLSEKLFTPFEYGAVPAYSGNGHQWLDHLGVNGKSFIDRASFPSDQAFADHIVWLLRNPDELQRMQNEPVFFSPELAQKRLSYGNREEANLDLYRKLRAIPRFHRFWNKKLLSVQGRGSGSFYNIPFMIPAFNISRMDHYNPSHGPCPDVIVDGCCRRL